MAQLWKGKESFTMGKVIGGSRGYGGGRIVFENGDHLGLSAVECDVLACFGSSQETDIYRKLNELLALMTIGTLR